MKVISTVIFFFVSNLTFSQPTTDTLKVVVHTKFGELTFRKFCQLNKFEFQQTKDPIFCNDVELEAQQKQIERDTLEVKFLINKLGKITSFNIVTQSRLSQLNLFIQKLFGDAIEKLNNKTYSLNCTNNENSYIIPLIYVRQNLNNSTQQKAFCYAALKNDAPQGYCQINTIR